MQLTKNSQANQYCKSTA